MADEESPSGSIEDRVNHKNWKWRVSGLEELTTKFKVSLDSSGSLFNEWGPQFKKLLADINAMSQEKVLEPLNAFIDRCDCVNKFAPSFVPILVEKLFASTRPRAKEKTIECLLMIIEADSGETVFESLLKGTTSPSPKIILASIQSLTQALKTFGPKVVPVKLILKQFAPWFENRDKNIREAASDLFVELYRWINKALLPLINESVTPHQLTALQAQFDKLPAEAAVPLKYTRAEAAKIMANQAKGIKENVQEQPEEIDPYALMSAVNILPKLTSEFYEGLASKKWQERQEQLDKLITILTSSPKIENANFGELCTALKKVLADANVLIMVKGVIIIGMLAEALRGNFAGYTKSFITPILEKYKEKKASIITSIHTTMNSLVGKCISFADIIDELSAVMQSKIPAVKQETLIFINHSIVNSKKPQEITKISKPLVKIFMDALGDTTDIVRDASSKAFASFGGIIGERGMTPYLNQLDPIKAKKIKDNMPVIQTPTVSIPIPTAPIIVDLDLPTSSSGSKKPAATKQSTSTTTSNKSSSTTTIAPTLDLSEHRLKLINILSEEIIEGLGKTNWKDRLQATEEFLETIKGLTTESMNGLSESIIQILMDKPGLKETNFQVLSNVFSIFSYCTKNDSSFTNKQCSSHYISTCLEKLSDIKLKDSSVELLFSTAESVSPSVVFSVIYQFTTGHKNPKIICDSLIWIQQAIEEFGIGCCSLTAQIKPMVEYIKHCLDSTSVDIKKLAIKLLVTLKQGLGSSLTSDYTSSIKKQLLDSFEKEYQKVKDQKLPTPSRQFKGSTSSGSSGGPSGSSSNDIPRTDISIKITPTILGNMQDPNWKTRSDALDEVERMIHEANRKIQSKLGGLVVALKSRLEDNNQKVILTTLNLIGLLCQSIGAPFEKHAKLLLPGVLLLLQDSKKPIRDAVVNCMNVVVVDLGFDIFVGLIAAPMIIESPISRKEILSWSIANAGNLKSTPLPADVNTIPKGIIACLQDKTADIRSLADQLFSILSSIIPGIEFKKEIKFVKPANQQSIQNSIDKYYLKTGQPINKQSLIKQSNPSTTSTTTSTSTTPTTTSTPSSPQPTRNNQQQPTIQQQQQTINQPSSNFIIFNLNGKNLRSKTNEIKCWLFDEPNEEVIEILQGQVLQCFTEEFANTMFSTLPTSSQNMADQLITMINENPDSIISVLDILFRWITFKLFDTGLASLKRVLKILSTLLTKLIELEYSMVEYEASCLVPILLEKSGSASNEIVKSSIKASIVQLEELVSPNILFRFATEVLSSAQNWRTRIEVLNLMQSLIDKNGASVCGNLKLVIPLIASNLNDPQLKSSCILCFSKLYSHIKDDCFKYHNFNQQDKLLIQSTNQSSTNQSSSSSNVTSSSTSTTSTNRKSITNPTDEISIQLVECLELFKNYKDTHNNIEHTVESLKQFSALMNNPKISDKFMNYAQEYFQVLTSILSDIFPTVFKDTSIFRLGKYLIHTIISIYSNVAVAKQASVKCLEIVLTETIKLYSQTESSNQAPSNQDSEWLSKAFNQILLRTLQNSNSTVLFSCLLQMMTTSKRDHSIQHPEKYKDLLLRCLLRATKSLKTPSVLEELSADTLLNDINTFLESNVSSLEDITKKTAKTLALELYAGKSTMVIKFTENVISKHQQKNYQHLFHLLAEAVPSQFGDLILNLNSNNSNLNNININSNLDSPMVSNVVISGTGGSNRTSTTTTTATSTGTGSRQSSTGQTRQSSTGQSSNITSTSTLNQPIKTVSVLSTLKVNKEPRNYSGKTDSQKKELLQEIFKKIGNKELTTDGILDLYYFQTEYPEYDITPNLNSSSQQFQAYIQRNLKKIKDSMESPKEKDDEIATYQERLKVVQNTFYNQQHQQQQQQSSAPDYNMTPQLSNTAQLASNTLQRLRTLNPSDQNNHQQQQQQQPQQQTPSTPLPTDLNSTVASLRQRLAQLTNKSE